VLGLGCMELTHHRRVARIPSSRKALVGGR